MCSIFSCKEPHSETEFRVQWYDSAYGEPADDEMPLDNEYFSDSAEAHMFATKMIHKGYCVKIDEVTHSYSNNVEYMYPVIKPTLDMVHSYIEQRGLRCLFCGEAGITGEPVVDVIDGCAYQQVGCKNCKNSWCNSYRLDRVLYQGETIGAELQ